MKKINFTSSYSNVNNPTFHPSTAVAHLRLPRDTHIRPRSRHGGRTRFAGNFSVGRRLASVRPSADSLFNVGGRFYGAHFSATAERGERERPADTDPRRPCTRGKRSRAPLSRFKKGVCHPSSAQVSGGNKGTGD